VAGCFQTRQVADFVFRATPGDQVQLRVHPDGPLHEPGQQRQFQADQVLARQIADEIRGREDGLVADELHGHPR